jgi:hypothetical protein
VSCGAWVTVPSAETDRECMTVLELNDIAERSGSTPRDVQIGLYKESENEAAGERFTLLVKDPEEITKQPGLIMRTISGLSEMALRKVVAEMGESDTLVEKLLMHARKRFVRQQTS